MTDHERDVLRAVAAYGIHGGLASQIASRIPGASDGRSVAPLLRSMATRGLVVRTGGFWRLTAAGTRRWWEMGGERYDHQ